MANIGIVSDYSTNILRRFFDPKLLATAKDKLQLAKLAQKKSLPKKMGSDSTIRFFRRKATVLTAAGVVNDVTTGNAVVSTLTDGTAITARRDAADYDIVNATLVQQGSVARLSDQVSWQHLFNLLSDTITGFGEELALHIDQSLAQKLVTGQLAANKVYAGGATTSLTLAALSQSAGKLTMDEILKAATNIKVKRGRPIQGGKFVAVMPVECTLDVQKDADWIDAHNYADPSVRIDGELGSYGSVRMVETTNGWKEDLGDDAEGTYDSADTAANDGFATFVLGADAFGTVELSGEGPYSPKIYVLNQADKSDPLNQTILTGWKAFWVGVVLNSDWYSVIRSKSTF
jgi:N4-gp56 family major capsid protein